MAGSRAQHAFLFAAALFAACGDARFSVGSDDDRGDVEASLSSGRFGINIDVDNPAGNPSGAALAAAGASIVRFELKDRSCATTEPDPAALQRYRQKLLDLQAAGVQALVLLDY